MTDHYLKLVQQPAVGKIIKTLRLPLTIPPKLARTEAPWSTAFLQDKPLGFGTTARSALADAVMPMLTRTGAEILADADSETAPHALVFDASGLIDPTELRTLYDFLKPRARRLQPSGRVIVLGRPVSTNAMPAIAATQQALTGTVRSLAKELGRRGATVHLIQIEPGAEDRLEGPLRFLLSPHAAYVNGQVLSVTKTAQSITATPWEQPLAGKTALVTGAAQGIGAAIARTLAREGARVVCLDRPGAETAIRTVAQQTGGVGLALDITDAQTPAKLAEALRSLGGVHVVVHNAGITRDRTLGRMPPDAWDAVLAVNLAAVVRIDQALLQGVLREDGRIIGISSIVGIGGQLGQTNYAASKAGIIGYVAALSRQTAARGITVNAIAPGYIETPMTAKMPWWLRQWVRRVNSLSQGGVPGDVAEAVTFLASPGAVGLTGTTLRVCGQNWLGA